MRSNKQIILQSADKIYLLAGEDAVTFRSPQQSSTGNTGNTDLNQQVEQSVKTNTQQKGPRLAPVVVFDGKCLKVSDRVFATCSQQASGISLGSLKLPDSLAVTGVDSKGVGVTGSAKLPAGC